MPPIGADVRLPGCDRARIAPQGPLEAYGYGTGPGTVIHDDGHLDDALDRRTDEDAPDARLTRPAEQGAEFADPLSGLFCGPGAAWKGAILPASRPEPERTDSATGQGLLAEPGPSAARTRFARRRRRRCRRFERRWLLWPTGRRAFRLALRRLPWSRHRRAEQHPERCGSGSPGRPVRACGEGPAAQRPGAQRLWGWRRCRFCGSRRCRDCGWRCCRVGGWRCCRVGGWSCCLACGRLPGPAAAGSGSSTNLAWLSSTWRQ